MLAVASRALKVLPVAVFITVCFLFILNIYHYDYREVTLPEKWKNQNAGNQKEAANPATTPLTANEKSDLRHGGYGGDPFGDDDSLEDSTDPLDEGFDMEEYDDFVSDEYETHIDGFDEDDDNAEGLEDELLEDQREMEDQATGDVVPSFTRLNNSIYYPDKLGIDWSKFAYVQYVTDEDYLCNSVMAFETLDRLNSRADRVMMYPSEMLLPDAEEADTKAGLLLIKARDEYNVKLQPIEIQHREGHDLTWADSFTKLLAFNQTQYERVLSLDSDGMVLQNMDELFQLPSCPVAMPRAYWMNQDENRTKILSSQLMVVQPSKVEFERILEKMDAIDPNDYDMEIVNELYADSALVLPHRKYNMLTGEFRRENHTDYLGSDREEWDPLEAYNEAKFVHFSDWPVPKPWIQDLDLRQEYEPKCHMIDEKLSCIEREIWNKLYTDFALTRKRVCKTSDPAQLKKKPGFWGFRTKS
ncbi:hypothetical protein ACHAPJ_006088 [Fusarium lateritium]